MALVVVLPFVAETTATPAGSRAASASIAPGSTFQSSFPGSVVPPPRPTARERRPTRRAADVSVARRTPMRSEPTRRRASREPGRQAEACRRLVLAHLHIPQNDLQ